MTKADQSPVPSASSVAAGKLRSSTLHVSQPLPKPCQLAAKSPCRAAEASQVAQALQLHLLPFPKLSIPLSSQLAKVHIHCRPGPTLLPSLSLSARLPFSLLFPRGRFWLPGDSTAIGCRHLETQGLGFPWRNLNPQSSEKWEFMTERGRGVGRERPKKRNEEERGHIVGKGQGVGRSQERGPVGGGGV